MKVIVLGLGSMGAAACSHLARRGAEVMGFDQFQSPHELGSHHGESRMIRQSYFEHPDYVPLLLRAYTLWHELAERSGQEILVETGGLYLAPQEADIVAGALRSAEKHGLSHTLLERKALQEQYPQFRVGEEVVGFYETRAGFLRPEAAIRAHLDDAREHEATLKMGAPIDSWEVTDEGVEIRCAGKRHQADHLVITAGAWAQRCLHELGIPLKVTRQISAWFRPAGNPEAFLPDRFPSWFLEAEAPFGYYGFPLNAQGCLKLALHKPGPETDPDSREEVTEAEREAFRAFLDQHIPAANGELVAAQTCRYTNSPDGHFIVGAHPESQHVTVATGFSGHGFKFASVIGEALADLALEGSSTLPIEFLSPTRFS